MIDPATAMWALARLAWLYIRYRSLILLYRARLFLQRPHASVVMYRLHRAKNPDSFFSILVDGSIAEGESLSDMRRDAASTAQRLWSTLDARWPDLDPQSAEMILRRVIQRKLRETG